MKVLAIQSGIFGEHSQSTQLVGDVLEQLGAKHGELEITERDLTAEALPYFDAKVAMALNTPAAERTDEQEAVVALSDSLIEEIKAADVLVLGVPMYNFGVPAQLKSWVDLIARAGVTFQYTEQGPKGLLADKPVIIAAARGGVHAGQASDSQTPFLKTVFGFIGLTSVDIVYAEGLNMGEDYKARARTEFKTSVATVL